MPYSEYAVQNGHFQCVSVKISFALTDVGVEDGCLAVIPGSHKSNFANPLVGQVPDPAHPLVEPLPCRAGDAVVFSEDVSHGAVENRGQRVRRTLFYSYAPAFHCRWRDLADPAAGLAARGNERRVELVEGLGQSCVAIEDRHFFDIAGYLELGKLLSPSQVQQARAQLQTARAEKDDQIEQWIHIIEAGGVLEDAMALASVQPYLQEFIWGNQYRLVGSRASLQPSRGQQRLKQGGRADKRRYARYRCTVRATSAV